MRWQRTKGTINTINTVSILLIPSIPSNTINTIDAIHTINTINTTVASQPCGCGSAMAGWCRFDRFRGTLTGVHTPPYIPRFLGGVELGQASVGHSPRQSFQPGGLKRPADLRPKHSAVYSARMLTKPQQL